MKTIIYEASVTAGGSIDPETKEYKAGNKKFYVTVGVEMEFFSKDELEIVAGEFNTAVTRALQKL